MTQDLGERRHDRVEHAPSARHEREQALRVGGDACGQVRRDVGEVVPVRGGGPRALAAASSSERARTTSLKSASRASQPSRPRRRIAVRCSTSARRARSGPARGVPVEQDHHAARQVQRLVGEVDVGVTEERAVLPEQPLEQAAVLRPQDDARLHLRRGRPGLDAHPLDRGERGRRRHVDARVRERVGAAVGRASRPPSRTRRTPPRGGRWGASARRTAYPHPVRGTAAAPSDFAPRRARFGHGRWARARRVGTSRQF